MTVAVGALARDAHADAVKVQFPTRVPAGQKPRVVFLIQEPIDGLLVDLTNESGRHAFASFDRLKRGTTRTLELPPDPGRRHWRGRVTVKQKGKTRESELAFDAVVVPQLQIQIDRSRVDVPERRLEARLSRPAAKATVKVFAPTGGPPVAQAEHDLTGRQADETLVITWPPPTGGAEIGRIDLRLDDVDGFFAGVSLFPWSVYIPHEEVNFATDKAAIAPAEQPKLEASYVQIAGALAKYRDLGPIKLYVAGHTDTVGAAAYNVKLSQRRAQAIAAWFRRRGLRIPIFFEGFGEHAPLVATPDQTDEPRNRRVDYILAVEDPVLRATSFRASWKPVP
jgi:outer membrane protein OmpA-like peptidoglycan-associated protein